ncbi:MFS transporter [Endozoicomonas sp. YOMI1]|uniref:MFS transporter n=1 Tax=Endozoicomonas sp. YOMI1 TaxID=2828739 RepID=UPI002147E74A|nr:MFS transporter [Endozoicomonas sp. YOMI1]
MNLTLRLTVVTSFCVTLEFYNFTLLIFLANAISLNFFPTPFGIGNIMPVFMVFFAGYLARFIVGLIYSHGGDQPGRKPYYIHSTVLMSLSTLGIALIPGHDIIGNIAPLLLLCCRLIQGVSFVGEVPGFAVFASGYSRKNSRGRVTGLIVSSLTFSNILASGAVWFIHSWFGEQAVNTWAWRIPFVLGAVIGLISLWLRYSLAETPVFESPGHAKRKTLPVTSLMKDYRSQMLRGVSLAAAPAVTTSVLLFMPRFQQQYLHQPTSRFMGSFVFFTILATLSFIFAILSDRVGRLPLIRYGSIMIIATVPASTFFLLNGIINPVMALLPLLIAQGMINGAYESSMVKLFPAGARYTAVAFCHNLAFCIFGGATPMLLEWLCNNGWLLSPGLWPAIASFVLMGLSLHWKDRYQDKLNPEI